VLRTVPKVIRDNYLQLCVYTPESKEDEGLKSEMQKKEEENMEVFNHPHKDIERWCEETKTRFDIMPGQDFGTLPATLHKSYLKAKCYRFFCEPHPKAGNGKFECIPLEKAPPPSRV